MRKEVFYIRALILVLFSAFYWGVFAYISFMEGDPSFTAIVSVVSSIFGVYLGFTIGERGPGEDT